MSTGKKFSALLLMVFFGLVGMGILLLVFKQINPDFKLSWPSVFVGFMVHVITSAVGIKIRDEL